jgi:hypothetical protein
MRARLVRTIKPDVAQPYVDHIFIGVSSRKATTIAVLCPLWVKSPASAVLTADVISAGVSTDKIYFPASSSTVCQLAVHRV